LDKAKPDTFQKAVCPYSLWDFFSRFAAMSLNLEVKAVIFDMDGVLADTEPLWQQAEMEIFGALGVPLTLQMLHSTMGLRCDEVVAKWHALYPWQGKTVSQVHDEIVDRVIGLVRAQAVPLPGVGAAIAQVKAAGLRIALASSSPMSLIEAMTTHLGLHDAFEILRSAEVETHGKPHPAVYLHTAADLGISPLQCVAIEDSFNGLLAAKAARMRCVLVPAPEFRGDPRWAIADRVLGSLEELRVGEW
jgi:mannitol-1-/sugar-/sorbitol-6-/2-deoxyglucose-6-phosphatase